MNGTSRGGILAFSPNGALIRTPQAGNPEKLSIRSLHSDSVSQKSRKVDRKKPRYGLHGNGLRLIICCNSTYCSLWKNTIFNNHNKIKGAADSRSSSPQLLYILPMHRLAIIRKQSTFTLNNCLHMN